ncbi:hypothetical protein CsatB_027875 [Cannabis sativa]
MDSDLSSVGQFSSTATTFLDWFKEFLMRGRSSMLDELLMVGWSIWKARNELLWKDRATAAAEVIKLARISLFSWTSTQQNRLEPLLFDSNTLGISDFYIKPTAGMIKINVDGAIFEDITQFGTGLIARDCQGKIIEAFSTLHTGVCQPAMAEVMSVKEALSWLKRKNLSNGLIETDCIVVQAIYSSIALPSIFGLIVQECQLILSSFNNVSISHVKRSANKAAHCIARGACY